MTTPTTYKKTPKGEEEIATRANRLSARERSLLVMADGKTQAVEIAKRAAALGDAESLLGTLLKGGFIAPVSEAVQPATTGFSAAHLEAARFASRYLLDSLGPASDMIGARVETCRDPGELADLLHKCREAIQVGVGRKKADEFLTRVVAILPDLR